MTSSDVPSTGGDDGTALLSERLAVVDPELSAKVAAILSPKRSRVSRDDLDLLEEETLWAMVRDIELGYLTAEGYARLLGEVSADRIAAYRGMIRYVGEKGVNLGRMLARYWVPVLRHGDDDLIDRFSRAVGVMRKKGEYTLKKPFDYLATLLEEGQLGAAAAFLGLLLEIFSRDLPYNECLHLARAVPETTAALPEAKRNAQISQLRRVARTDVRLVRPFMTALSEKLCRLSEDGLRRFVTAGLEAFGRNADEGLRFLSLASRQGIDAYRELLVTVALPEIRGRLNRYLKARTGLRIALRPMSATAAGALEGASTPPLVLSDGRCIYLADEIGRFPSRDENREMYTCLVRLESAVYEFGTYDFDLERTLEGLHVSLPEPDAAHRSDLEPDLEPDLERFFGIFPEPALARDLFTVFEQGRLRVILGRVYPGVVKRAFPFLVRAAGIAPPEERPRELLSWLYRRIGMGETLDIRDPGFRRSLEAVERCFEGRITPESDVNAVGALVFESYPLVRRLIAGDGHPSPLSPPFGRRFRSDLHFSAHIDHHRTARRIQTLLRAKGVKVYRQDLLKRLVMQQGVLSSQDLREMTLSPDAGKGLPPDPLNAGLPAEVLAAVLGETGTAAGPAEDVPYPVYWYREWDHQLGDYLHDHVRVLERPLGAAADDVYQEVLRSRRGLVRNIRRAFELLRPEGLVLLRRWTEGDDFDYRALIDFAVERKAGILPSDRLYIKRVKQQRDVAVLLLVDLSRSTANRVFESAATVLDLEKEAVVLFAEALTVVGDNFAVAGFSGTGRLGVDYYRIKDFDAPVDDAVRGRISAVTPQRSTRTGAAVRHATAQLAATAARVRLLIILGDGFPNDTGYKREYAIADTRKAIAEARAKGVHARAITVNILGDERLDDLYGSFHHNVISDVRELPAKLLRIYGTLTR
ncbi:nitric oxide reductase activation protein NorD [Desulfococcus sp.]|uniref:nitric oxide reductase activation protein NorD n=1 Tax=Desulfococcus sp. TaxID=2025834 RepID=UPI003D101A70